MKVIPKHRTRSNPRNPQVHRRRFEGEQVMKQEKEGRTMKLPEDMISLPKEVEELQNREKLGEVQSLPTIVFKRKSPW
jgi:hypothetical protein